MRIFALDSSGSMATYADNAIAHIRKTSPNPDRDIFVTFDSMGVSKPVAVSQIDKSKINPLAGDGTDLLIDWANDRTLQKTDELVIYHDLHFDVGILSKMVDGWFTPKFKIIGQPAQAQILLLVDLEIDMEFV